MRATICQDIVSEHRFGMPAHSNPRRRPLSIEFFGAAGERHEEGPPVALTGGPFRGGEFSAPVYGFEVFSAEAGWLTRRRV